MRKKGRNSSTAKNTKRYRTVASTKRSMTHVSPGNVFDSDVSYAQAFGEAAEIIHTPYTGLLIMLYACGFSQHVLPTS